MTKLQTVSAVLLATVVAACGVKPLTPEQKARLVETVADLQGTATALDASSREAGRATRPTASGISGFDLARVLVQSNPQLDHLPAPMKRVFGGYLGFPSDASALENTFSRICQRSGRNTAPSEKANGRRD